MGKQQFGKTKAGQAYPKRPLQRNEFHDFQDKKIVTAKNVHEEIDCTGRKKLVGTHPTKSYNMHKYIPKG